MKKSLSLFSLCLSLFALSLVSAACSKDDDSTDKVPAGCGQVSFELVRSNVYLITSLNEVRTIKITVVNDKGVKTELPSLELNGDDNLLSTKMVSLPVGNYFVESYRCFDKNADIIDDLDITLTSDNAFSVVAGEPIAIPLPVQVKKVLTTSNLFNSLYGLCYEVLGPDRSKWPPSWDFDGEGIDATWAGLEFEWDVATNTPAELIGIVIDGDPQYVINSDTGEKILVSLPEFKHMKKLPACIANFMNLDGITIRNCDMEELCPELEHSTITSLTIYNTKLKSIPAELARMRNLYDVWIEGNNLSEFPEAFTHCKDMYAFVLKNEPGVTSVPESIANWNEHLVSLNISGTGISSLPDVFDKLYHISLLELDNNPKLSTLPATIGMERIPYEDGGYTKTGITGLSLDGCSFTEIPAQVKRPRIQYLSMCNNRLTSVSKADFDAMPDLQTLKLDGNKFTSFPALTNPQMGYLSLMGCGLSRANVDISGMTKLNPYWFFCE